MELSIGAGLYLLSSLDCLQYLFDTLEGKVETVSSVLSSYSFTVAGFLATIATFLVALRGKTYFDFYRSRGSLGHFVFFHVLMLLWLLAIFVLSLLILAYPSLLRITLSITVLSFIKLALLCLGYYVVADRANS